MKTLLAGKEVSAALVPKLQERAQKLKDQGIIPTLATIRIGERLSDIRYESSAKNAVKKLGLLSVLLCYRNSAHKMNCCRPSGK